jgi:hypothetical protein
MVQQTDRRLLCEVLQPGMGGAGEGGEGCSNLTPPGLARLHIRSFPFLSFLSFPPFLSFLSFLSLPFLSVLPFPTSPSRGGRGGGEEEGVVSMPEERKEGGGVTLVIVAAIKTTTISTCQMQTTWDVYQDRSLFLNRSRRLLARVVWLAKN